MYTKIQTVLNITLAIPVLLIAGCKTVVRENIISTINTGFGVTVAENPETQLYEIKVGYIRSQFYSIPTGKVVENEDEDESECCGGDVKDKRSNRADITPEVVSGIRVNGKSGNKLFGGAISENFAVGKEAVNSPAAVAMYVSSAENPVAAQAASEAVTGAMLKKLKGNGEATIQTMDGVFSFLKNLPVGDYPKAKSIMDDSDSLGSLVAKSDFDFYNFQGGNLLALNPTTNPLNHLPPSGYERVKVYRGALAKSIEALQDVTAQADYSGIQIQIGNNSARPLTDADKTKLGKDLKTQEAQLKDIDDRFSAHPVVDRALKYFSSLVN